MNNARCTAARFAPVLLTAITLVTIPAFRPASAAESPVVADLATWTALPAEAQGATVANGLATLTSDKWSFLASPRETPHVELAARISILEPARQFQFFGNGWSAWPAADWGDQGCEAGLLVRASKDRGYRIQFSTKHQTIALVKYPDGGYLRVVPCKIELKQPLRVVVRASGEQLVVLVDGRTMIDYRDNFHPLVGGRAAIGASSLGRTQFDEVSVRSLEAPTDSPPAPAHQPNFSVRTWLGERSWVFDGDEPILELHDEKDPSCFAKLRPGYKPQLTFDSHWGLENQGAFPEAASKWTRPTVSGGGATLQAAWSARNVKDRFTTRSTLVVGFDARRGTYTYDIDSQLEVLPGEPFHFRYGFDFEHHTPLDPFRWQYLIAKRKSGELYHRPVYPIDPGQQADLEPYHGRRVWYGRHLEKMLVAPAVEYGIQMDWNRDPRDAAKILARKLNTAVCAAFYDTGVSFEPETAPPGTKIRVQYRYTGYDAAEADQLFRESKVYDSPTLDPNHHYIFADEWPKVTFGQFEPLSKSWIYGRTPFMSSHNVRPTYELEKNCGAGSGFAMKLGPASFGKANLPVGTSLVKGRWLVSALVKSINAHGPGARMVLEATQAKTNKPLLAVKHFFGNGSFDWQRQSFAFELAEDAGALSLALGNSGTGETLVTDVEFRRLGDGETLPPGAAPRANDQPPRFPAAPVGAIADLRMLEGKGHFVFNHAVGPLGHLDLANLDWVVDSGRPALRFAENTPQRRDYRRDSGLGRSYFGHSAYAGKDMLPIALAGFHGGGGPLKGVTLAAWIKPAAEMGKSEHGGKGDVVGFGARRFVLGLHGQKAPYQLAARINVNDLFVADAKIAADEWRHVALTAEPRDGQWRVTTYLDGRQVAQGMTTKFAADSPIPPSLILGAELFYMHDAYYRGLIGRTLVFERALSSDEIGGLAGEK